MKSGKKYMENDGSSYMKWMVFKRHGEFNKEILYKHFPYVQIHSAYDCTGRWFSHYPTIKVTKTRILVKQYWGMDI